MLKLTLATFAVCFVLISDAAAQCPGLFAPIMRTRVTVVHRHVYAAPMVAVQAAPVVSVPVVEAPAPEIVAPAPAVTYYRAAPVVSSSIVAVGVGSPRAARKSAHHAAKAAEHTAKAAYWASRS